MKQCSAILILGMMGLFVAPASAGVNVGGTLILHANPSLVFTGGGPGYCDMSDVEACSLAVATIPADGSTHVIHVFAAFSDSVSERLSGITFGVEYDSDDLDVVEYGSCGDFEIASPTWPEPGSGTAITWDAPQSGSLIEAYWIAAYIAPSVHGALELIGHPTQGANFADDSIPSQVDSISSFGTLGYGEPGEAACPELLPPGESGGEGGGEFIIYEGIAEGEF